MDFLIKDDVLVRYTRKYADPEIVVPEGIREIADQAFSEVKHLQHVHLPNSLERIGKLAFSKCRTLQEIVVCGILAMLPSIAAALCEKRNCQKRFRR